MLRPLRNREERARIDSAISAYYSSLSVQEAAEHAAWGEFALREFTAGMKDPPSNCARSMLRGLSHRCKPLGA